MNQKGLGRSSADEFQGHIMVSPKLKQTSLNKQTHTHTNKKQTYIHTCVYCFTLSFPHVNMKFEKFPLLYKEKTSAYLTRLL